VWVGQFLVPFRALIGSVESAMLFVNIFAAAATFTFVYATSRRLGAGLATALGAILICASSQVFIELTNQYLLEAVQSCAAASMVFVAWQAEKRSLLRTLSLLLMATAFSFLTKTSSATFVLPLLVYVFVSLIITRRQPRPAARFADVVLLVLALMIAGAAIGWYVANWDWLVRHFVASTFSDTTLYWGSPVYFPRKIAYWLQSLATSLSPFLFFAVCLSILTVIALVIAILRSYRKSLSAWAEALVENGGLFALALAGTVIATLLAFSLQINEDRRYLIPLIPLISVLGAWSLVVVRGRAVPVFALVVLVANAAVTHSYAHNRDPFSWIPKYSVLTPYPWWLPAQPAMREKLLLTAAVHKSCRKESAQQPIFVAIDYPNVNVNSANFYSEKERRVTGLRCHYVNYGSFQTDVQRALNVINGVGPAYVLTVAPDQQAPADAVNVVARPVAEHLAHDPQYELASEPGDYILIYRKGSLPK
jgi:4-amino-4-deoxy-L-arabinose transferase-like glycosyltransferase